MPWPEPAGPGDSLAIAYGVEGSDEEENAEEGRQFAVCILVGSFLALSFVDSAHCQMVCFFFVAADLAANRQSVRQRLACLRSKHSVLPNLRRHLGDNDFDEHIAALSCAIASIQR